MKYLYNKACLTFFRNLSQGSSDTGFFGSMEKDKRRKKVDDTKPDAEDVIDELLEGVDLKQGAPEEADSKYLNQTLERPHLIDDSCV